MTEDLAVKILTDDQDTATIAGWGVVFGGTDLSGETFTPETDFKAEWYEHQPLLYDHTMNEPQADIGRVVKMERRDYGLWIEAEINKAKDYAKAVLEMIGKGVLGFSTGSASHVVRYDGKVIKQWPIVEVSLTTTPCEPRTVGVSAIQAKGKQQMTEEQTVNDAAQETELGAAIKAFGERMNDMASATDTALNTVREQIAGLAQTIENAPAAKSVKAFVPGDDSDKVKQAHLDAFNLYLRTGDGKKELRAATKAAMHEDTDSEGGYLVPTIYSNEMIAALKDMSILRMVGARVMTMRGTNAFSVPTMTHGTAAVITREEGAYSEVEPTVGETTIIPWKYTRLAKVSEELLDDSRIDIMSQVLMPDFTQAFAASENTAFTTGTGVRTVGAGYPQGVTVGASDSGVDTATASTISADNIIDAYHSLGYLYRQKAVWLMNDTTIKAIRKLKETTTGQYLWQPGLTAGQPDSILGRPVYTLNTMPELGTEGNKVIIFGDLSYFWIVDFGMAAIRRLDELYSGNGQVGFRMNKRFDSYVMLSEAIKYVEAGA